MNKTHTVEVDDVRQVLSATPIRLAFQTTPRWKKSLVYWVDSGEYEVAERAEGAEVAHLLTTDLESAVSFYNGLRHPDA